jgi:hypothetical protein
MMRLVLRDYRDGRGRELPREHCQGEAKSARHRRARLRSSVPDE